MPVLRRPSAPPHVRWVLLLLLAAALAACQRQSQTVDGAPEIAATLAFDPDPAKAGPADLVLHLQGADGQPLAGAQVRLKGDMSHAGMQPVLAEASDRGNGDYRAAWVWTMAGDWFVTVTATLPDGRTLIRRFDLRVASP